MVAKARYSENGKTCARCRVTKPLSEFKRTSKGHPHSYCHPCKREDGRERRNADIEKYRAASRMHHTPEYQKARRLQARNEAYDRYGGECRCCGETEYLFLTLDHINDDGVHHRSRYPSGIPMYAIARREGYPDYLQLLCYNCNCGRARNGGVCPHQEN